ncbi:4'-phosphopantetheinyl transferase family protein [Methylobacter marinus]|uniref:4'-phosphopantetheinyl transferase family protein n=1 Tax=Methylobacter marinus TaxID=34058 RepID=UPI00036135AF|nr:4'-phosphopantetheinyl transferase superfamily protein [Methylobacter marinus]
MSNTDTVDIWQGLISTDERYYQCYLPLLDEAEQAHADSIKNPAIHRRYVEVHGRTRLLLADYLRENPATVRIGKGEHGKPYLIDYPQLAFNLSHSGPYLVMALGWNCQLGIDIEICKDRPSLTDLVHKCLADEEAAYWHALPEAMKTREFYRFWTRKEAFVKATGRGLGLGLSRCVINPVHPVAFLSLPEEYGPVSAWRVRDIDLGQDRCAALVANNKDLTHIRIRDLAV